jgi:hypothetical protein
MFIVKNLPFEHGFMDCAVSSCLAIPGKYNVCLRIPVIQEGRTLLGSKGTLLYVYAYDRLYKDAIVENTDFYSGNTGFLYKKTTDPNRVSGNSSHLMKFSMMANLFTLLEKRGKHTERAKEMEKMSNELLQRAFNNLHLNRLLVKKILRNPPLQKGESTYFPLWEGGQGES